MQDLVKPQFKSMSSLKDLFIKDIPLIDVRAPIEFESGHFPTSVNLPLMNNEERAQVGTCYKKEGQAAALALGHRLVSGNTREHRIDLWAHFIQEHPHAKLYCFRGGLRSQISTAWIKERGIHIEFIPGGYKALRNEMINTIQNESQSRSFFILGGRTGVGKTEILNQAPLPFLDLEKAANHKGSSFGILGEQPSQITFENRIAVDFLKHPASKFTLVEDESIMIGSAIIPRVLFEKMKGSPMIVLEKPLEERILHIIEGYVFEKTKFYAGDFEKTHQFMDSALTRIEKRLGGLNTSLIRNQMQAAFNSQEKAHASTHREWVKSLLEHYYDPVYDRSLKKNESRIKMKGTEHECLKYLEQFQS